MPATTDLEQIEGAFLARHQEYKQIVGRLPLASPDAIDGDTVSSIIAEGTFIRYFTLWENAVERSFIYFCQGGATLNAHQPVCRLTNCEATTIRKILTGGQRYLDWSDQRLIRDRSALFFENGVPFYNPIIGKSQVLSDAEKIRNVIAHDSLEALNGYKEVQRNNFQTERNFAMPPGHLLRTRARKGTENWCEVYFDQIAETFAAILRP